jgi:outer membrane protein assembly factor BamB
VNRHITLCLALGLSVMLTACGKNRRPYDLKKSVGALDTDLNPARPALPEQRIHDFGFAVYWDSFIRDETIVGAYLEGDVEAWRPALSSDGKPQLYAVTEKNRIYQVDLHSGMVNWVYDVGRQIDFLDTNHPIGEWVYPRDRHTRLKPYDEIYFIAQDHLYALDRDNGSELWKVHLPFGASTPPIASATHVFVGSWDDRIYAIRKDRPNLVHWSWRTNGDLMARPLVASPNLFVPSTDGNLYTFEATRGRHKATFPSEKRLVTDPLIYQRLLYLGAEDYNLYVMRVDDGSVVERFNAQAPITTSPVAVSDALEAGVQKTVLFGAEGRGMFALRRHPRQRDSRRGRVPHELLWQQEDAERFLARGTEDAYLLAPGESVNESRVLRVDFEDGHFRDALVLENVDHFVTNANSPLALFQQESRVGGMIVLSFRNGWIVCLKELNTYPSGTVPEPRRKAPPAADE